MPSLDEMFSTTKDPMARGEKLEGLKKSLDTAVERHDKRIDGFVPASRRADGDSGPIGIIKGAGPGAPKRATAAELNRLAERFSGMTKSLSPEMQAEVEADLQAMQALKDELSKDISTSVPGNLHPYDLEDPAKRLVPRFTPLRNEIPAPRASARLVNTAGFSVTPTPGLAGLSTRPRSSTRRRRLTAGRPRACRLSVRLA